MARILKSSSRVPISSSGQGSKPSACVSSCQFRGLVVKHRRRMMWRAKISGLARYPILRHPRSLWSPRVQRVLLSSREERWSRPSCPIRVLRDGPSFLFENAANRFQGRILYVPDFPDRSLKDSTFSIGRGRRPRRDVPPRSIQNPMRVPPSLSSRSRSYPGSRTDLFTLSNNRASLSATNSYSRHRRCRFYRGFDRKGASGARRRLSGSIISMIITILL